MVAFKMVNAGETPLADGTAEVFVCRGFHGESSVRIGEKKIFWGKNGEGGGNVIDR
jgi:hypothetical protein